MPRSSLWLAVLAATALRVVSVTAQQTPPQSVEDSSYETLIHEALSEFNDNNYAEARALFERAHALKPNARTLRGLGITAFELKRYVQSMNELEAALAETHNPLTETQRSDAQALILKASRFVGKVKLELTPSDASVWLDGRSSSNASLVMDLGEHAVSVRAAGYRDAELKLVIDGGEDTTQRVELLRLEISPHLAGTSAPHPETVAVEPPAAPAEQPGSENMLGKWWFWTAAGAVVAGVAVGTAVALSSHGAAQQPAYSGTEGSLKGP